LKNLDVRMDAIINDGSATLLSRAYTDNSTRFGLILGTGTNASVILPVTALSPSKFDNRPQSWLDRAQEVLVNTEFSMFGKNILPMTRWDDIVNDTHVLPDFQPFEHMLGGRYLGEIVRLIMIEAIEDVGLFNGQIPNGLHEPYSLDTAILAAIEADTSASLLKGTSALTQQHALPVPPSTADMQFLRTVTQLVTHRAAALLATAIHSLWTLRATAHGESLMETKSVTIGCNGSVIERYPGFRALAQRYVDDMTIKSGAKAGSVVLEVAVESAIYGAAVAVACLEGQEE
jgi:hexokinase